MIINVLTSMRRNPSRGKRKSLSNTNHVFIYVLGLSIVDLVVILHLPFLVVDLLKGQWLFGTAMCKLYWFGESISKLISSFIMTVLSWDRYLAVCSPVKSILIRSNFVAVIVMLTCSLLAVILLLPVLIQATVFKIDKIKMIPLMENTEELRESNLLGTTMSKCMFDSDAMFTLYTFIVGFVLPALFITFFYSRVIYKVQKSSRNMRGPRNIFDKGRRDTSTHRVQQVTKRIIAVILFYFFCWTPQWTLNILSQFNLIHVSWMTPALSSLFFIAHLLVCFNSAANPVLYALINRELRQQHVMAMQKKRQSFSHATQGALEFVARHTHKSGTGPSSPRKAMVSPQGGLGQCPVHAHSIVVT
uniref:G_PROTEIN_RECEP_F1_2 domain-containing protein n=1 Tax=Heterorhabditis bacteriophora TaxID=37862 RepID=A0A1I7XAP7_HETBA